MGQGNPCGQHQAGLGTPCKIPAFAVLGQREGICYAKNIVGLGFGDDAWVEWVGQPPHSMTTHNHDLQPTLTTLSIRPIYRVPNVSPT